MDRFRCAIELRSMSAAAPPYASSSPCGLLGSDWLRGANRIACWSENLELLGTQPRHAAAVVFPILCESRNLGSWSPRRRRTSRSMVWCRVATEAPAPNSGRTPVHLLRAPQRPLRALCEALLEDPGAALSLQDWAPRVGASARTLARLFQQELGMTFGGRRVSKRLWQPASKGTFQFDRIGGELIDEMGVESLMWGSDYRMPMACGRNPRSTSKSSSRACLPMSCTRSLARTPASSTG